MADDGDLESRPSEADDKDLESRPSMVDDRDLESQETTEVRPSRLANANLVWKDVKVSVNGGRTILHGLSGCAEPGRVMAIMGPSGAGKSTLLDTLAGRQPTGTTVTGQFLLNGRKAKLAYGAAAYLAQDVLLMGTLTVYETLYYSAKFRFPDRTPNKEIRRVVTEAMSEVGLIDSANTPIGNWHTRGVSGGEKKRVSIAVELLTSPHLVFMDEPTSGLDSSSSFHVIKVLKNLAENGRRTILCSIHQPSSEVFELFDDLCLLSDGKQVYLGPLPQAMEFFRRNGFQCPPLRSPSDHYLHCVNSDFDKVVSSLHRQESRREDKSAEEIRPAAPSKMSIKEAVKKLTQAYAASDEKKATDERIELLSHMDGGGLEGKGHQASFFMQSLYLTKRSFVNMFRDFGYFWLRVLVYVGLCICLGTVYYDIGSDYNSIMARSSTITFVVGFMSFMAIGGFPTFIEDMKVYKTERMSGHYRVAAFVIGNSIASIPFIFLISALSTAIIYPLIKLHGGVVHVIFFLLSIFGCLLTSEAVMMAVCSVVSNFLMGVMVGAGAQGLFLLVSGFFRQPDDIPDPIWKYPMFYVGYFSYGYQGLLQNEITGKTFEGMYPDEPRVSGNYILREVEDVPDRSKWWNLGIIFLFAVGYRVIFYILLRLRERVLPSISARISKTADSFVSKPFWSRRHRVTKSSLLESLNSDMGESPVDLPGAMPVGKESMSSGGRNAEGLHPNKKTEFNTKHRKTKFFFLESFSLEGFPQRLDIEGKSKDNSPIAHINAQITKHVNHHPKLTISNIKSEVKML